MKTEDPTTEQKKTIKKLDNAELVRLYKEEKNLAAAKLLYTRNKAALHQLNEAELLVVAETSKADVGAVMNDKFKYAEYETLTDESLVIMGRLDNPYAVEVLTVRYYEQIKKNVHNLKYRKGMYVIGEDDDDLYQHAAIAFIKSIRNYKIETGYAFKQFVRHVIKRKIESLVEISLNNKNQSLNNAYSFNLPVTDNQEDGTFEQMLMADNPNVDSKMLVEENLAGIWATLNEQEKSVCWYYAEDMTYEQIGNLVFNEANLSKPARIKAVDNTVQKIKVKRDQYVAKMLKESY